jgi:hypothetical protein
MPAHTRLLLSAGIAVLSLLAIPQIAGANPGAGPRLVQRTGTFVILHADIRAGGSTRQPMLATGVRETPVRAPDGLWIEPGSRVRLEGTMQGGALVLADSETAVRRLAASPNAVPATNAGPSIETTAIVMFRFQGQPAAALPAVAAVDALFNTGPSSLKGYYLEQTYGQIAFQAEVLPPVQLAIAAPADCNPFDWSQDAFGLMPSFDPSLYGHLVFIFPALPGCKWSGLADVGGSNVWINGAPSVAALAHELGHNLGLAHAGGLSCSSSSTPAPMGESCAIDRLHYNLAGVLPQYADPFDAMGNAPLLRQMNMEHKLALGVLPESAVQTVGTSGTYQLAPMETLGSSVELLVLPKPQGGNYYVEYRQPAGFFDSQPGPTAAGVLIHTESPDLADPLSSIYGDSDTALIDMHADGVFAAGQWQDAAMRRGEVFSDVAAGVTIEELAADANGASLKITLGDAAPAIDTPVDMAPAAAVVVPAADGATPSAPFGVKAAVTRDGQVRISWGASTDDVGVASYRVLRAGAVIARTTSTAYVDRTPKAGARAAVTYSVIALDGAGNASPAGSAQPLRAALLRKLRAMRLTAARAKAGTLVRVQGRLSDSRAVCRLRLDAGAWHSCRMAAGGAFSTVLRGNGARHVTVSLRDELGRVSLQTLRIP